MSIYDIEQSFLFMSCLTLTFDNKNIIIMAVNQNIICQRHNSIQRKSVSAANNSIQHVVPVSCTHHFKNKTYIVFQLHVPICCMVLLIPENLYHNSISIPSNISIIQKCSGPFHSSQSACSHLTEGKMLLKFVSTACAAIDLITD